jgi:signal peptidase I
MSKVKKHILDLNRFLDPKFIWPFFITLFAFLCIKQFVFDVVFVQSPAMNNTLRQNEMVFITKIFSPQKNNIVRISLPLSDADSGVVSSFTFKRIVGAPGDTIEIRDSKMFVNGKLIPENDSFLHNYIAKIKKKADTIAFGKAEVEEKYLIDDSCVYLIPLTEKKFLELKEQNLFSSLITNAEDSADFDVNIFPNNNQYKWNKDFYGPIYIPKKGDTLKLDSSSIKIYKRIIADFENNKLEMNEGEILVNEIETDFYVVRKNYYFVTGDNFDSSVDSRNWGFIPENKIKSKLLLKR